VGWCKEHGQVPPGKAVRSGNPLQFQTGLTHDSRNRSSPETALANREYPSTQHGPNSYSSIRGRMRSHRLRFRRKALDDESPSQLALRCRVRLQCLFSQCHSPLGFQSICQLRAVTGAFHFIDYPTVVSGSFRQRFAELGGSRARNSRKSCRSWTTRRASPARPFSSTATNTENFLFASHPINCSILLLHRWGFARSVSKTLLQRFHSIIIGIEF
jgi:hypothetical protein